MYISLITDVFSHKIMGYQVARTLDAIESVRALKMALLHLKPDCFELIHHSDRGCQYCSKKYVKLLQDNDIKISMTESGDPLENAVAERINGIIKEEYLSNYEVRNFKEAKLLLVSVIALYNSERPHMSIGNLTPTEVHDKNTKPKKLWKSYYKKRTEV